MIALLACLLGGLAGVAAPAPQDGPADARDFLAWQADLEPSDDPAVLEARAQVYLQRGAADTAAAIAMSLGRSESGLPAAQRILFSAAALHPRRVEEALEIGRAWLAAYPGQPAAEREGVASWVAWLEDEAQRRAAVGAAARRARLLPLAGLGLCAVVVWLALRAGRKAG